MSAVTSTSIAAYHSAPIIPLRDRVEEVIRSFGVTGCITDDVIAHFAKTEKTNTGRITGRFSELVNLGKVVRLGDTRPGVSGKQQLVMRHADFVLPGLVPAIPRRGKKNPFLEGMKFAAKVVLRNSDLDAAKRDLRNELLKVATR